MNAQISSRLRGAFQTGRSVNLRRLEWVLGGVVLILVACSQEQAAKPTAESQPSVSLAPLPQTFRKAFDFTLSDARQTQHTLSQFKGKIVLLHFWASWCAPCIDELPEIIQFIKKYPNVQMVAVSLDQTWKDAFKYFPKTNVPSNILSLIDPQSQTSQLYGSYQFPETYLINKNFEIAMKWIGPQKWDDAYFTKILSSLN